MKKTLILGILTGLTLTANSFAVNVPFVSKHISDKQVDTVEVDINGTGTTYNLDINNTPCKKIFISNGRLSCVMDINGDEVTVNGLIIKNGIDITGKLGLTNVALLVTIGNERYKQELDKVTFSVYSDYSYNLDGYNATSFATKDDFKKSEEDILSKIKDLDNEYIKTDELASLPLNSKNEYCDINNDPDCHFSNVKFLKKDPFTGKINLDLLINYSE